jgi:hypothetical protein
VTLATGGTVTDIEQGGLFYRVHTFTTSGDFVVSRGGEVEYLIVAGGGGGAGAGTFNTGGGGGGAGGFLTGFATVGTGTASVVVGAGGAGGSGPSGNVDGRGGSGGTSSAFLIAVEGGGGGGFIGFDSNNGASGGSGGGGAGSATSGAGGTGTSGQGNNGGNGFGGSNGTRSGGGGGGRGGVGSNASSAVGGNGGTGHSSSITGTSVAYAGGGGGGSEGAGGSATAGGGSGASANGNGSSATDGTGGGGGGACRVSSNTTGGDGGDGVVIIRYLLPQPNWRPNPTVEIGGTDYTAQAIDRIRIFRGRRTVYERPNAGYASISLRDIGDMPDVQVGREVVVRIDDIYGIPFVLFTGTLSDWQSDAQPAQNGPVVTYRLQAVGPLATLNRRVIFFDGRAAENDAERVEATLVAALGTAGVDPALIDPGVFDLAALGTADAGYSALTVAQDAGFSGEGLLFENPDGLIGYTDADRRLINERAGALNIPFAELSAEGLSVLQQLADITNSVTVTYATGAVSDDDTGSIGLFGLFETELQTQLVNQSNAEARALQFLQRHATPRQILDTLRFNLLSVGDSLRDGLLGLGPSSAVRVTGIPARVGFTEFRGVRGGVRVRGGPVQR